MQCCKLCSLTVAYYIHIQKVFHNKSLSDISVMRTVHYITALDQQPLHTSSAVLTNYPTVGYIEILILMGADHQ